VFHTTGKKYRLKLLSKRELGRIRTLNRDEITGGWRRLHREGFHNLYSSQIINRIMKSRRMRWTLGPDNIQVDHPFMKLLKTNLGESVNCLTLGKNLNRKSRVRNVVHGRGYIFSLC
jgi:hypothetical protein